VDDGGRSQAPVADEGRKASEVYTGRSKATHQSIRIILDFLTEAGLPDLAEMVVFYLLSPERYVVQPLANDEHPLAKRLSGLTPPDGRARMRRRVETENLSLRRVENPVIVPDLNKHRAALCPRTV
jgi:hypothetical protein